MEDATTNVLISAWTEEVPDFTELFNKQFISL
jgi:hypothetical protein